MRDFTSTAVFTSGGFLPRSMLIRSLIALAFCLPLPLLTVARLAWRQNSNIPIPTPVRPLTKGIPNVPGSAALSLTDGSVDSLSCGLGGLSE